MRDKKLIFQDFNEGEITFPPTFKFDKGTEIYDSRLVCSPIDSFPNLETLNFGVYEKILADPGPWSSSIRNLFSFV